MMISYPWAKFASARMVNQLRIGFKVFGIILCHRFRLSVFLFSIWRYLEERHLFRVGFHEVIILVYKNLVLGNLVADWLMIWSEFIWTIFRMKNEGMNLPKWTRTKSSTNQRPDYRGPSSNRPKLLLHGNPPDINAFCRYEGPFSSSFMLWPVLDEIEPLFLCMGISLIPLLKI